MRKTKKALLSTTMSVSAATLAVPMLISCQTTGFSNTRGSPPSKVQQPTAIFDPNGMKFDDLGYTTCDAKALANYWRTSAQAARLRFGAILNSNGNTSDLDAARGKVTGNDNFCTYGDCGYTYDQAVLLASYWARSTSEAKTRIVHKYLGGMNNQVQVDLSNAMKKSKK